MIHILFNITSLHLSSAQKNRKFIFFSKKVTLGTQLIYRWGDAKIHWICTLNKRFSLLLTFFFKESHRWVSYRSCICLSFYPVELQRCLYNTQNANKYYGLHFHLSSHHGISHKIYISCFFWWKYHWHSRHTVWPHYSRCLSLDLLTFLHSGEFPLFHTYILYTFP